MYASGGLRIVCLTAFLFSCGLVESSQEKNLKKSNGNLRRENVDLREQIQTIGPGGAGLREIQTRMQEINKELEASKAAQEALSREKSRLEISIADLSSGDDAGKIIELRRLLIETETKLSDEQRNFAKLNSGIQYFDILIKNSLQAFLGMYINQGPPLQVGASSCRLFVHADVSGILTRALACNDGRLQWEKQIMRSFDSVVDDKLEGKYGFGISGETLESSCKSETSYAVGSSDFHFARASRYGEAEFSVKLRTDFDGPVLLDNAAITYTSNDCDDLISRSTRDTSLYTPEQRYNLDLAAGVCRFIRGEKNLFETCFTSRN